MPLTRASRSPAPRDVLLRDAGDVATREAADSRCEDIRSKKQVVHGQSGRRGREPAEHRQSSAGRVTKLIFHTPHGHHTGVPAGP